MQKLWWDISGETVSWVEITERPYGDIGKNLWVTNPESTPKKLISEPRRGSLVFHWYTPRREFVGFSKIDDEVSRPGRYGVSNITGRGGITWRRKLGDFQEFPTGVLTLENIRRHASAVKKIHDSLLREHGRPLHLPFAPAGNPAWRELRPRQTYLAVCPSELAKLFFEILEEYKTVNTWYEMPRIGNKIERSRAQRRPRASKKKMEEIYRRANQDMTISWGKDFRLPTKALEHSSRAHARIQNSLGSWLESKKLKPFSPNAGHSAQFDIAWNRRGIMYVCEVKSLNRVNEDQQLRLGLGQVLHYQQLLSQSEKIKVRAVLAVEREPSDSNTWLKLAKVHGVKLVWKATFKDLLT